MNSKFPYEMLYKIFVLFSPTDLCGVGAVCRRWQELGEDPHFWLWNPTFLFWQGETTTEPLLVLAFELGLYHQVNLFITF